MDLSTPATLPPWQAAILAMQIDVVLWEIATLYPVGQIHTLDELVRVLPPHYAGVVHVHLLNRVPSPQEVEAFRTSGRHVADYFHLAYVGHIHLNIVHDIGSLPVLGVCQTPDGVEH